MALPRETATPRCKTNEAAAATEEEEDKKKSHENLAHFCVTT